jgi:hypothetical protein
VEVARGLEAVELPVMSTVLFALDMMRPFLEAAAGAALRSRMPT